MYLSARGKTILVIHHSHNTATQFLSKYTQGLLFVFLNYLKFTFQHKSRSPLRSMQTRLWIEKKMFPKHFQYRCLSKAHFSLRGNSPWFAVSLCAATILFAELSFSEGKHQCTSKSQYEEPISKTVCLKARGDSPALKSQIHHHRLGYYFHYAIPLQNTHQYSSLSINQWNLF